jgi:hemolysin activation/secretion protein
MISRRRYQVVAALVGVWVAGTAQAQQIRDEGQRLLDEQRARERMETLTRPPVEVKDHANATEVHVDTITAEDVARLEEMEPAFVVNDIVLSGDRIFSEAEKIQLAAPFLGQRLGSNRINLLLKRITAAYLSRGYLTTRAYLGPQNVQSGRLEITVIPGTIESISLDGQPATGPGADLLPLSSGKDLRLADIEQSVDQINRLRSRRAEAQILPGQTPGGSGIVIETRAEKPWRAGAAVDNYGQPSTGKRRQREFVEFDNLLGLWDAWSLTAVQAPNSRSELLSMSMPVGYGTFSYAYSQSMSETWLASIIKLKTESTSQTFGWNQVVYRDKNFRLALDGTLSLRESRRRLDTIELEDQRPNAGRLAASLLYRGSRAIASGEIGYSTGLGGFGGTTIDVPNLPKSAPHNQFEKWDINANLSWAFADSWIFRSVFAGQIANTGLPGQEQLFLGGAGNVRGFQEGILSGERGFYMRNELAFSGTPVRSAAQAGVRLDPFLFYDTAAFRLLADPEYQRMTSAGIGLRLGWEGISADLAWAKPVSAPAWLSKEKRLHFMLTAQF